MAFSRESQLTYPVTTQTLNKNIKASIYPFAINDKPAIRRPTRLFGATYIFCHNLAFMCIKVINADLKLLAHTRGVGDFIAIGGTQEGLSL